MDGHWVLKSVEASDMGSKCPLYGQACCAWTVRGQEKQTAPKVGAVVEDMASPKRHKLGETI